jgi:hypothetical protein
MCAAGGEDSPAETLTFGGAVELDACDKHRSELQPLEEALRKFGRPVGRVKPRQRSKSQREAAVAVAAAATAVRGTGTAPRFVCGACNETVAYSSRDYHANRWHDTTRGKIAWTEVPKES